MDVTDHCVSNPRNCFNPRGHISSTFVFVCGGQETQFEYLLGTFFASCPATGVGSSQFCPFKYLVVWFLLWRWFDCLHQPPHWACTWEAVHIVHVLVPSVCICEGLQLSGMLIALDFLKTFSREKHCYKFASSVIWFTFGFPADKSNQSKANLWRMSTCLAWDWGSVFDCNLRTEGFFSNPLRLIFYWFLKRPATCVQRQFLRQPPCKFKGLQLSPNVFVNLIMKMKAHTIPWWYMWQAKVANAESPW